MPSHGQESEPFGTEPESLRPGPTDGCRPTGRPAPEAAPVPYAIDEPEPPPAAETSRVTRRAASCGHLRRRWYVAVPAGLLLAAALGYGASEFIQPDYTARTLVAIAINHPGVLVDGVRRPQELPAPADRPGQEPARPPGRPEPARGPRTGRGPEQPRPGRVAGAGPEGGLQAVPRSARGHPERAGPAGTAGPARRPPGGVPGARGEQGGDRPEGRPGPLQALIEEDKVKLGEARLAVTRRPRSFGRRTRPPPATGTRPT